MGTETHIRWQHSLSLRVHVGRVHVQQVHTHTPTGVCTARPHSWRARQRLRGSHGRTTRTSTNSPCQSSMATSPTSRLQTSLPCSSTRQPLSGISSTPRQDRRSLASRHTTLRVSLWPRRRTISGRTVAAVSGGQSQSPVVAGSHMTQIGIRTNEVGTRQPGRVAHGAVQIGSQTVTGSGVARQTGALSQQTRGVPIIRNVPPLGTTRR